MGAGDENRPEALLAGMDAAPADFVVLAAAVLPPERRSIPTAAFCQPAGNISLPVSVGTVLFYKRPSGGRSSSVLGWVSRSITWA